MLYFRSEYNHIFNILQALEQHSPTQFVAIIQQEQTNTLHMILVRETSGPLATCLILFLLPYIMLKEAHAFITYALNHQH